MAKILLVEDDNNLREIYEARLQAEGYDIVSARDGEEALTVAMKERPDLIISDVMMPKISGFDMLDIIRSTEETKDAKVIMMTALSQAEDKERADKLGADRYLVKSQVTLEDVAKVAREVLSGQTAAPDVTTSDTVATPPPTPTPTPAPTPPPDPVTTSTDEPVTPAPTADPQPVAAEPVAPTSTPTPAVAPDNPTPDPSSSVQSDSTSDETNHAEEPTTDPKEISQSIEEEQSAIAAQIESFIETKKTGENSTPPTENPPAAPEQKPPETEETTSEAGSTASAQKKIIQPINDINASKGPDLHALVQKEVEKGEMAVIAESLAHKEPVAPEPEAPVDPIAPEVAVSDDGDLKIVSEVTSPAPDESVNLPAPTTVVQPTPEPTPTTPVQPPTAPVIPHDKGTSIDGVVQPPSAATPSSTSPDPDTIAL